MNAIIPIICCVIYANVFSIDAYLVPGVFGGECYERIFPALKNHELFNYPKLYKMILDVQNNAQKYWSEVQDGVIDTFDDDVAHWNYMITGTQAFHITSRQKRNAYRFVCMMIFYSAIIYITRGFILSLYPEKAPLVSTRSRSVTRSRHGRAY